MKQFWKYVLALLERISNQCRKYITAQKMKFSIKDFFSKCDQIRSFLAMQHSVKIFGENFLEKDYYPWTCPDVYLGPCLTLMMEVFCWGKSLREKCPHSEFSWSVFSHIRTEYGNFLRRSPYSVQIPENTDQKNSEYRHFLRSK